MSNKEFTMDVKVFSGHGRGASVIDKRVITSVSDLDELSNRYGYSLSFNDFLRLRLKTVGVVADDRFRRLCSLSVSEFIDVMNKGFDELDKQEVVNNEKE